MATVGFTEISVHLSQTTQRRIPQGVLLFSLLCREIRRSSVGDLLFIQMEHGIKMISDVFNRNRATGFMWRHFVSFC